jgi:hypothetical protein
VNKYIFPLVVILIFSVLLSAQTKQKRKLSHPPRDTILFEVLKNLADKDVCGAKADSAETYIGTVLKRDFAEDEMRLSGFVLRTARDNREYINLDYDHISGAAASATSDLRDWLIKGRKMKVFVYRCRRILIVYKIIGL